MQGHWRKTYSKSFNASQFPIFRLLIKCLRWLDRLKGTKILFKYGEERSIECDCTYEGKTIFLRFYSKWLLWKPATPFWGFNLKHRYHWRQQFLIYDKTSFDFQTSTSCKFLFLCVHWAKVLTVNSCFQYFLQALCWNNLILQQTQWTNFLVSRDRCEIWQFF